jgi:four helix bundle protein
MLDWASFGAVRNGSGAGDVRMSYRNLEIWQLAQKLTFDVHWMSLKMLPKYELYEEGSQIRRAMKSVRSNIVEGYGRRRYKQEFIRFLTYAQASCDETMDHLLILHETVSLADDNVFNNLQGLIDELGRKINRFIQSVERGHRSVREEEYRYGSAQSGGHQQGEERQTSTAPNRATRIKHPGS